MHSLSSLLPRGEPVFHLSPIIILEIFKDLSAAPEKIQRLFRLQVCLSHNSSTISRKYSKTFWAAAIKRSNQQQQSTAATSSCNQPQQPAAATSSSNQQQQPAAAINSSNQYQQSTAAISSNNQLSSYQQHLHNPRRLPLVPTTVPSRGLSG